MHNDSFVYDGNKFTISFQDTLREALVFSHEVLPHHGLSNYTFRTEFLPPNGLGTVSFAIGSGIHRPSTTKQYS
jgi:hypothetical protein